SEGRPTSVERLVCRHAIATAHTTRATSVEEHVVGPYVPMHELDSTPTALTNARRPDAHVRRAAGPGENPPEQSTTSRPAEPSSRSTQSCTPRGASAYRMRTPPGW